MNATDIIRESETLPASEKLDIMRHWLDQFGTDQGQRKVVQRLLLRLENPAAPDDVWRGFEECEDGQTMDLDEALGEPKENGA